ncbi:hypothetical protein CN204_20410 [Sinorhizobium meliloti]|nr:MULTISPECIES: hypothetical protein [Sinorhizobium]MDW9600129.1 hypothetical protein [Sinorhizobium meliloti]MDW9823524.1 hypothetical protein [Sinorhizobium meliloti]MDW9866392.1 hypothetical protein [Sinorhizobium meliloti]MDX0603863.1 hypothetical protein [Sinorhizobium medicae]MDX0819381.1 hypothetical protein [Sinorhizobium medicae]
MIIMATAMASAAHGQEAKTHTFIQCTKFNQSEQRPRGTPVAWAVKENKLMQVAHGRYKIMDQIVSWPISFRDEKQIIYNSPSTGRKYDISFYRLVIDLQHHSMHEERYERYQSTTNHGRCTIAEHADDGSPRPPIWHSPEGKDFDQVGIEY